MHFATLLALVVPLVAAIPQATTTTSSAAATSTADLEAICESQAGPYTSYCPQCLHNCADSSVPDQCFYSVFTVINAYESDCEAHGGNNCLGQAINEYC
ncbi:hypothetical protein F4678DRAFT_225379 [Xylaria arbuscula]|nr:hypothetical protein F4678DRAFT_225379 [Xylaria arbuscula]